MIRVKLESLDIPNLLASLIPIRKVIIGPSPVNPTTQQKHDAEAILNDLCSKIQRGSESDMEKQVHEIIINNVRYDDSGKDIDHNALGPLLHKSGVCDGIYKLAIMIFDRIGIQSKMVAGTLNMSGSNPCPHAWNKVRIDGHWYNLDITEDMGLTGGKKPIRYDYFNLSDADILKDHQFYNNPIPCTKTGMDYYTHNGFAVSTFSEYKDLLRKAFSNGEDALVVKLPSGLDSKDVMKKLSDTAQQEYMKTRLTIGLTVGHSYNPDQRIFHVRINRIL